MRISDWSSDLCSSDLIDYADAETIEFHKIPPAETGPGYKTWDGRGQNIVIAYSAVEPGAVLAREAHCDEYMAFFPDQEIAADIDTTNGSATDVGYQLAIIPPGSSQIKITSERGAVMRVFRSFSPHLADRNYNAAPSQQDRETDLEAK